MQEIYHKNQPLAIVGTMTGTSLDGLDLALVHYTPQKGYQLKDFQCIPFPKSLHQKFTDLIENNCISVDIFGKVHFDFAHFTAKKISKFLQKRKVNLISFPGQTIRHQPEKGYTLQIGCPGVVAALLSVDTVGNFREQDVALGGQGAPLVPFVDKLLFSGNVSRILLNIGGIANITYLPKNSKVKELAFDTGPGNILINGLMQKLYQKPYDKNGEVASTGKVDEFLLQNLLRHPYFALHPPKSTGQKVFGSSYVQEILKKNTKIQKQNIIATATAFTAKSIAHAINNYTCATHGEIIPAGGGVYNGFLMNYLQQELVNWKFKSLKDFKIIPEAKEAFAFAILAHQTVMGKKNHCYNNTGGKRPLVLGSIYRG